MDNTNVGLMKTEVVLKYLRNGVVKEEILFNENRGCIEITLIGFFM